MRGCGVAWHRLTHSQLLSESHAASSNEHEPLMQPALSANVPETPAPSEFTEQGDG